VKNIFALVLILISGAFIVYGGHNVYHNYFDVNSDSSVQVQYDSEEKIKQLADFYFHKGLDYSWGWSGKEVDHDMAAKWYLMAGGLGDVRAQYNLCSKYYNQDKNLDAAIYWCQMSHNLGHAPAGALLGNIYYFQLRRPSKAVPIWKQASENGSFESKVLLATEYAGQSQHSEAIDWYKKITELPFEGHISQDHLLQYSSADYLERMRKHYEDSHKKLAELNAKVQK
jgi:TPR repeat protein